MSAGKDSGTTRPDSGASSAPGVGDIDGGTAKYITVIFEATPEQIKRVCSSLFDATLFGTVVGLQAGDVFEQIDLNVAHGGVAHGGDVNALAESSKLTKGGAS